MKQEGVIMRGNWFQHIPLSKKIFVSLFFLIIVFSLSNPFENDAYAEFSASLIAVDSSDIGTRTPLILVHGIHGKESGAAYWHSFISYFNRQWDLPRKYKLYK